MNYGILEILLFQIRLQIRPYSSYEELKKQGDLQCLILITPYKYSFHFCSSIEFAIKNCPGIAISNWNNSTALGNVNSTAVCLF